ncbi:autotransporter outer membrane beta-barrel domain-containing protein [Morganella psychrotolerans]|uniref:autotransporter outer membrane beta-barrel domain-containing protein n=1 Tax=Morganella psychrotolerans TaxID=368603 RepID=UPI0039B0A23C
MRNYKVKTLSLVISGIILSPTIVYASTVIEDANLSSHDTWAIFNDFKQYEVKNTVINVTATDGTSGASANGLVVNANGIEDPKTTTTLVQDSTINAEGSATGAYIVGGVIKFDNTKINSTGRDEYGSGYGIITKGGDISIENGSIIESKNTAGAIHIYKGNAGTYFTTNIAIDNSSVTTESTTAFMVSDGAFAKINVINDSMVTTGNPTAALLLGSDESIIDFNLNKSSAIGSIIAVGKSYIDTRLSNYSSLVGYIRNVGVLNIDSTSSWDIILDSDVNELANAGVIRFSDGYGIGSTLTVHYNYIGNDGTISFNAKLAGDDSLIDKMIIEGDSYGNTNVIVNNIGGKGAGTIEGIKLIHVDGQSDGIFTQSGRIVAGAYDYSLVRRNNNWILTSQLPVEPPVVEPPVVEPPVVEPPVVEPPVVEPPVVGPPVNGEHVSRPEGGSYIANLTAANTLFNTSLHDRLGETQYIDVLTGEKKVTSLWLRQVGKHNGWRDNNGQLKTQSNSYVIQLGGDIAQWSTNGLNQSHLGLMTGYANSHSKTNSSVTSYDSKGSVNGYSVGVYGTWFANDADKSGLYVDTWLQYNWFNNDVNGEQLASESYKSKGLTASLETGYTIKMGDFTSGKGTVNEWFIQPTAQATWMGVVADQHREDNGTLVNSDGDGNVQTRLGIRAYLKSHYAMDEGKGRTFEPFIEANWLHNTRSYSATMDDVRISQAGARNIGEVKVGVEGQISPRLNLWGNIGTQVGDKGYNDSSAMIGVKYNF